MDQKKQKFLKIFFISVIAISILVRCFDFSDLLLLKGDQVRDILVTDRAMDEGAGSLSLLGPRAGGTMLRLGPAFYYFQYVSAKVLGENTPASAAIPNLIFGIGSVFLAYFLLRKYFSQNWSLALTAFYACTFLLIEHARFTWNPNSLPFFTLLFLFSLMQIFSERKKHNWLWVALAGLSLAIAGQLHFTSFIALPIFLVVFLFFQRKKIAEKIRIRDVFIFFGVILFFYIPVILSDVINHGDNLKLFFKSIGTKKSEHSLFSNILKDIYYFGKYFFRILTGYFGSLKVLHYLGSFFVLAGLVANWFAYRKEKDEERKRFLLLIILWVVIFFLLYIPLAYDIDKPRFFLPLIFIVSVWIGFMGKYFWEKKCAFPKIMFIIFFCVFLLSNIISTSLWLFELSISQQKALSVGDTVILKTKKDAAWWTWGVVSRASLFMRDACEGQKIFYYLPKKVAEFSPVFDYAHESSGDKRPIRFLKKIPENFESGCYFLVEKSGQKETVNFEITKQESFGDITVAMIKTGISPVLNYSQNVEKETGSESTAHQRAYWKDVFDLFGFNK